MKIEVNSHTVFRFPTVLLINRLTAVFICVVLKKYGLKLKGKQMSLIIKEIKRYKKYHSGWNFVECSEKNGDSVIVKI